MDGYGDYGYRCGYHCDHSDLVTRDTVTDTLHTALSLLTTAQLLAMHSDNASTSDDSERDAIRSAIEIIILNRSK